MRGSVKHRNGMSGAVQSVSVRESLLTSADIELGCTFLFTFIFLCAYLKAHCWHFEILPYLPPVKIN